MDNHRELKSSMLTVRINAVMRFLAVFVLCLFFLMSFLQRHVYNHDFWWHLATGKYIVENKILPQNDPFSYTSHEAPTERKSVILKGNWLAEVIFYKVYNLWDLKGIIVLRAILMLLFLFFIFIIIKKQGSSDFWTLFLTSGVFIISMGFLGERPQLFTFLVFAITFYLLEDFRINKSKKIYVIPALMILLSNIHMGYIICILLISLYLAGEGISFIFKKNNSNKKIRDLFIVWIIAVMSSLFNPTGISTFLGLFSLGQHIKGIVEFMPPFYVYAKKFKPIDYPYIVFLLLSLLSLRYLKKIGLTHILMLIIFTILSFTATRFMIFYMCATAPILSRIISYLKEEKIFRSRFKFKKEKEVFLYMIIFIIGVILIFKEIPSIARYEFTADTSFAAPKDAANFLEDIDVKGNMFNEYGMGGYLIWRLYPDKKVFIDGRSLEFDIYEEYNIMASAGTRNNQSWEDIIKKYDITYIVMPPLLPRGEIYPIIEKLFEREDWAMIYCDHLTLIFLRRDGKNISIINKFAMDKSKGFNTIIIQASGRAMKNKTNPYYLMTLGKIFYKTGKYVDAKKAFELARERDPKNPVINKWLQRLREN